MEADRLSEFTQSQKERLTFIDFRLYFLGDLSRTDLVQRFGIKEAAATRDITQYRELAPQNLNYDPRAKQYRVTPTFQPLFEYSPQRVLAALTQGLGDDAVHCVSGYVASESPILLSRPQVDVLSHICRAIHLRKAARISYYSLNSGQQQRDIVPFALVSNGLRWHVRAYDRLRERFSDFVLTRITKPLLLEESAIEDKEGPSADIQWNRMVELHLTSHPNQQHSKAIELDFGMTDGVLSILVRAAVAGYLLRLWNVDCSKEAKLVGNEYHLWLKNRPTLYGVDNLAIAPGYDSGEDH